MISSMLISLLSFPDEGRSFFGCTFLTRSAAELTRETISLQNANIDVTHACEMGEKVTHIISIGTLQAKRSA